jgi:hypothetical protein
MTRRFVGLAICVPLLIVASGCVRESTDGDVHKYSYEIWIPLLVFLGGVVAAPVGWHLKDSSSRFGWALLILGPIAALGFAPSLFLDRIEVAPDRFSRHSGIWGMTAVQEFAFDEVQRMKLVTREERGRRGRRQMRQYLVCSMKNGETHELPTGNELVAAAIQHIANAAGEKGVEISQ